MEDKQMIKYPFFRKLGAFSVNLENKRSVIRSLRYALSSLEKPRAALYIYPEGTITPASQQKPDFQQGLAWLAQKTKQTDFVPVAVYIHTLRHSKAELYISIGNETVFDNSLNRKDLNNIFENEIHDLIKGTKEVAGFDDQGFRQIF